MGGGLKKGHARRPGGLLKYYTALVVVCLIAAFIVSLPILAFGNSLVWRTDGIPQHLNALTAVGIILRNAFRDFVAGHGIIIQEYVYTLGFGVDATSIVSIWDPLNWSSALVPQAYTEYLFCILIFVRVALCAVTFSMFCLYKGNSKQAAFIGSMVYAFSGFALFWGMIRHPFMLNTAYVFPLVMLGLEKVFNGEKPTFFVMSLALSFILSAYFSYMVCIFTVLYYIVRYATDLRKKGVIDFLRLALRFLGYGAVALLISGAASFPYIAVIASLDRVGIGTYVPDFYSVTAYLGYISTALDGTANIDTTRGYIGPVAMVLLIVFTCCRKQFEKRVWAAWLAALISIIIFSLIPYFGHVFNGMSYVTDRWYFFFDFCIAYISCLSVPVLQQLERRSLLTVGAVFCVVFVVSLLPLLYIVNWSPVIEGSILALAIGLMVLAVSYKHTRALVCSSVLVVGIVGAAALVSVHVCVPEPTGGDYQSQFVNPAGSAYEFYTSGSSYVVFNKLSKEERSKWRYSIPNTGIGYTMNESLNQKRNGMAVYVSRYNQSLDNYRDELGIADYSYANNYAGSNSRLALDAYAGAKYFIANDAELWRIPYSYSDTGLNKNGYTLYKTDYALPLAFSYANVLSHDDYLNISMEDRQEALLQTCVLENADVFGANVVAISDLDLTVVKPEMTVECSDGVTYKDGAFEVSKAKAFATIRFEGVPQVENYLVIENFSYTQPEQKPLAEDATLREKILSLNENNARSFGVTIETTLGKRNLSQYTRYDNKYCGKDDWVFNAGYSGESINEMKITFKSAGTYSFDSLEVALQPVEPIAEKLSQLQESGVYDVKRMTNRITATADLREQKECVVFTQAYSSGWTAWVDGEPHAIVKANSGFIGLVIEGTGEHQIELRYETPGLHLGLAASITGVIALLILVRLSRKRARTNVEA